MTASLRTDALTKRYGGLLVTDAVSIDIRPGEIHALIGPNGAGKTTLINQLSGELASASGKVWFADEDITTLPINRRARSGLLRSYQITSIFDEFSVLENVVFAAMAAKEYAFQFWRPMVAAPRACTAAQSAIDACQSSRHTQTLACDLAYGERRQLELAMSLATEPRFLLLDEPMAGMSSQESAAVIALLQHLKGRYTVLLVEHDMDAVFTLADRISVLVYGKLMFTGTPDEIRSHPEIRRVYLGEEEF